jgi:hypothetical protein
MTARPLLTLAMLLGCGRSEEPRAVPTPGARPVSKANAHADAADTKAIPRAGMVCRGTRAFVWTEDGTVEPLRAVRPLAGRDGEVYETYESVHSLRPGAKPVTYRDALKTPPLFITSATSMLVQASAQRFDIYRDGVWTQHARTEAVPARQAVEHANAWWVTEGRAILRVVGDTLATAATLDGAIHALLAVGPDLWTVSTSRDGTGVVFSLRSAQGAFAPQTTIPVVVTGPAQVAQGPDRAAVLLPTSPDGGSLFLIDPAGRPERIAEAQGLGAFDAAHRLWYRTSRALVAREANGDITTYPFSRPMFGGTSGTLCVPFGGGFSKLPSP